MNESVDKNSWELVVNGETRTIGSEQSELTLAGLLEQLDAGPAVAVELNGVLVPRDRHAESRLNHGDQVEIVSLTGGG